MLQVDGDVEGLTLVHCLGCCVEGKNRGFAAATSQDACRDDSQPQRDILQRAIHILSLIAERALNLRRWRPIQESPRLCLDKRHSEAKPVIGAHYIFEAGVERYLGK